MPHAATDSADTTNTLRRVGIDALFVLGVPIGEVELHYFRFDRAYDGCIHHAVVRGKTLCGLSTVGSNCEGRTLGDNECDGTNNPGWPSCLRCAASLRKLGLCPHWERQNAEVSQNRGAKGVASE